MKALIIDRVSPLVESGLKEYGVEVDLNILPSREELKDLLPSYDLLVMRVDPKMDKEMLDACVPNIKMICICSTGVNHIDLPYAGELGIKIQNAPGLNSNAVAELTISKMLDTGRFTMEANDEVQNRGIWNKYKYTGHELKGHVVGVIGLGQIGSRVAKIAKHGFDMEVIAYDPYITADEAKARDAVLTDSLDALLEKADYITVHTPLTDETRGMIGKNQFAKMKKSAIVINCARGGIIDEGAALEALSEERVTGVSLDVLSGELAGKGLSDNAKLESPLFHKKGFTVSPHIGGSTHEAYDGIGVYIVNKVAEFYGLKK